jgi:hypothetical protein
MLARRSRRWALPLHHVARQVDHQGAAGLYEYDAVSRLRDSQLGDPRVSDIANYIRRGKLWEAFDGRGPPGAADRRDRQGRHRVPERPAARARPDGVPRLRDRRDGAGAAAAGRGHHRNNEKELPDAFLRRCFFHYIRFPDRETMRGSSTSTSPASATRWSREALEVFFGCATCRGLQQEAPTSELLDWLKLLMARTSARGAARAAGQEGDPADVRRAAEERAGHPALRAPRFIARRGA